LKKDVVKGVPVSSQNVLNSNPSSTKNLTQKKFMTKKERLAKKEEDTKKRIQQETNS